VSDSLITFGRTARLAAPVVPSRRILAALRRFLASDAASWIIPVLLLLVWQGVARAGLLPANVVPAPSDVFDAAWRLTLSGELLDNVGISAKRAGIGFAIGGSLAFAFGLLNGVSKIGEKLTDATFQMVRNIPNLPWCRWSPGSASRMARASSGGARVSSDPINTFHGIHGRRPAREMGRSYGMSTGTVPPRDPPGALPSIFVVRYALGIMWRP
jgi:sulfonate transport system permease protein